MQAFALPGFLIPEGAAWDSPGKNDGASMIRSMARRVTPSQRLDNIGRMRHLRLVVRRELARVEQRPHDVLQQLRPPLGTNPRPLPGPVLPLRLRGPPA